MYDRGLLELREVAERSLRKHLEEGAVLRWQEETGRKVRRVEVVDTMEGALYMDGSRVDVRTAAATITRAKYLGRYATVMDAERLAVAMGSEIGDLVLTDSRAAIGRIRNLQYDGARGWIEQRVEAAARQGGKRIEWVKGHNGLIGNERADLRAKKEVWMGGNSRACERQV